jgi:hypothetical protein
MRPGTFAILFGLVLLSAEAAQAGEPAPPPESPVGAQEAASRIEQAEAARREAAERGAEWLATQTLIEQARREAEMGNWQQAADLAEQALQQGNLAVEQAERESGAWRERVVR